MDEQSLNEHHTEQEKIVYFNNLASSPMVGKEFTSSGKDGYDLGVGSLSAENKRGAAMVRIECVYSWVEDEEDTVHEEKDGEVVQAEEEEETALNENDDDEADAVNEEDEKKKEINECSGGGQYEVGNYFEWMPAEKQKARTENDKRTSTQ